MIIAYKIIMLLFMAWSGLNAMTYEDADTGPSVVFLISGTLFILSYLVNNT